MRLLPPPPLLLELLSIVGKVSAAAVPPFGSPPKIGPSFGNGVAGFPICAEPVTIVNHTLSAGATHGVLHHFWSTGAALVADRLFDEYWLDGETTLSISFQPICTGAMCSTASCLGSVGCRCEAVL